MGVDRQATLGRLEGDLGRSGDPVARPHIPAHRFLWPVRRARRHGNGRTGECSSARSGSRGMLQSKQTATP